MTTAFSDDPEARRRRVLRRICSAAEADYAVWFTVREVGEKLCYSPLVCEGDSQAASVWSDVAGRPAAATLQSGIHYPRPEERRAFQPLDRRARWDGCEDPAEYAERCRFYEPRGIGDEARMLVYRGQRFLGWIGVFRWQDREGFGAHELSALNATTDRVTAELTAADSLENEQTDAEPVYLVATPSGDLVHVCDRALAWLSNDRRRKLAELIEHNHREDAAMAVMLFENMELRISRMHGPNDGLHYLVHLVPVPIPTIATDAMLTPAQREIAEYAVAGATVHEIARTTGRSPNTVRYHIKNIYERLGIGSRAELVSALSD